MGSQLHCFLSPLSAAELEKLIIERSEQYNNGEKGAKNKCAWNSNQVKHFSLGMIAHRF